MLSLFSLLLSPALLPSSAQLEPSEWSLPREKEEVVLGERPRQLEGSARIKQNMRGSTLVGFGDAELSRCLPAAFSVWCWERSIHSTRSDASDCLPLVMQTSYRTQQVPPHSATVRCQKTPGYLHSDVNLRHALTWLSHTNSLQAFCQTSPILCAHSGYFIACTHALKCLYNFVTSTGSWLPLGLGLMLF